MNKLSIKMDKQLFLSIKEEYGENISWAVWKEPDILPKSNIGDLGIFDLEANPGLLNILKNNVVFVGLNFARPPRSADHFINFHDDNARSNDFKIRYAFRNTQFYGAYMTDFIKGLVETSSGEVKKLLKADPRFVKTNIEKLKGELKFIGTQNPIILAFGGEVYNLLNKNLSKIEYDSLVQITHYSDWRHNKEKYRKLVIEQIFNQTGINIEES